LLAMFQRGGGHLADRHQTARREDIAAHLLQEFVDPRAVGIKAAAIALGIGGKV
jgi:predicted homoserine dehydrogenase-like protein